MRIYLEKAGVRRMEERHLREERDALRAAAEKLRERLREEAVDRLARLVIGPEDAHTGADRAQEIRGGGALLALCLLQVRAELLLCAQPASASRESLTRCVAEVFRSAGQAVEIPWPEQDHLLGAGLLLQSCADTDRQWDILLDCIPARELELLQTWEDSDEEDERALMNQWELLRAMAGGCAAYGLQQEGCRVMQMCLADACRTFGEETAWNLYVQVLLDCIDQGGSALAAACGDAALPGVQRRPDTLGKSDFFWMYGIALHNTQRYEEAQEAFRQCMALREGALGLGHLLTCVPRAYFWYVRLVIRRREWDGAGVRFLVEFLEKMLGHGYGDLPYGQQLQLLGPVVFGVLGRLPRMGVCDGLDGLLDRYRAACEAFDGDPGQSYYRRRYAYTLAGVLDCARGSYNRALEDTLRAREVPFAPGMDGVAHVDDATLDYNAGYLYCVQGHVAEGLDRLDRLIRQMEEAGDPRSEEIYQQAVMVCYSCRQIVDELGEEKAEQLRQRVKRRAAALRQDPSAPPSGGKLELVPYSAMLEMLCSNGMLRPQDLPDAVLLVRTSLDRLRDDPLYRPAYTVLLYQLMLFLWMQNDPECARLADPCEALLRDTLLQDRIRSSCHIVINLIRRQYGGPGAAVPGAVAQLEELDRQWKNNVCTLDDTALTVSLVNARAVFANAYCILRPVRSEEQMFGLVLRGKALAALAGRERNRILMGLGDEETRRALDRLRRLQNRQTALYAMEDPGGPSLEETEREVARLSARIESAMPDIRHFTPITPRALAEKLPEGSALVEYYWAFETTRQNFLGQEDGTGEQWLDVYLLRRQEGTVRLYRRTLPGADMDSLQQLCGDFRACCRDAGGADRKARARKNALRSTLYRTLVAPVEDLLAGVRALYIAPEELLRNIPYGLLGPDGAHTLDKRFTVTELICGRDILFATAAAPQDGAFVVGDPDYRAGSRDRFPGADTLRHGQSLQPLPFSGLEARMVARCTGGRCLTGDRATKQELLRQAGRYGILHIATHGDFDQTGESNALFSARIYLAGAQTFLDTGREDERCGNGILTADEISRMDLHGTGLAVLSACFTGMGEANTAGSVQGLVSAFAAAGVGYVVTSLWEADDFAAAELMRRFYRLLQQDRPVPDALREAKASLAQATVAQLKQAGWDALRRDPETSAAMRAVLDLRLERADSFRPFADEHYWGGFVCHRCR